MTPRLTAMKKVNSAPNKLIKEVMGMRTKIMRILLYDGDYDAITRDLKSRAVIGRHVVGKLGPGEAKYTISEMFVEEFPKVVEDLERESEFHSQEEKEIACKHLASHLTNEGLWRCLSC